LRQYRGNFPDLANAILVLASAILLTWTNYRERVNFRDDLRWWFRYREWVKHGAKVPCLIAAAG
jgi:hypothetical protein